MKKTESRNEDLGRLRVYRPEAGVTPPTDPTLGVARMKNMYIDRESGALSSIPGYRRLYSFEGRVYTILRATHSDGVEYIYVHAGHSLYRFPTGERDSLKGLLPIAFLADGQSFGISLGSRIFLSDGERLIAIDADGSIRLISEDSEIAACRAMAVYDGRLFLAAKNKIIYSSPLSGGIPERICDGEITDDMGAQITALLSGEEGLWIFSDRGITRRVRSSDTAEPYPVSHSIDGIETAGGAIFSIGKILFLSGGCLCSLEGPFASGETRINRLPYPLIRPTSRIIGLWKGYALILSGEDILLYDTASTRGGFYPTSGLGSYIGDSRVYRYSEAAGEGYDLHRDTDAVARGEIISLIDEGGETIYFEQSDKKKYRVYPTEEFCGGEFYGISALCCGEPLLFGSSLGELFILTDDSEHYAFGRHAAEYLIELHADDCGLESLTKDTLPASLTLKLCPHPESTLDVTVIADGRTVCSAALPASTNTLTVPERAAGWLEKKIIISSKAFCSPISVRSVSYRYKPHGRVKNKT